MNVGGLISLREDRRGEEHDRCRDCYSYDAGDYHADHYFGSGFHRDSPRDLNGPRAAGGHFRSQALFWASGTWPVGPAQLVHFMLRAEEHPSVRVMKVLLFIAALGCALASVKSS
jgi:hypothetical protein